jgi:hypothetical protein
MVRLWAVAYRLPVDRGQLTIIRRGYSFIDSIAEVRIIS